MQESPQCIIVEWADAHAASSSWTNTADIDAEPCVVISVGILLIGAKPNHVVIAQSNIKTGDMYDHVLAIPTANVISMTELSVDHSVTFAP